MVPSAGICPLPPAPFGAIRPIWVNRGSMFFGRNSRRHRRFNSWLQSPFDGVMRLGVHAVGENEGAGNEGEGEGETQGNPPAGTTNPVARPAGSNNSNSGATPSASYQKALKDRKKYKAGMSAVLKSIGIDPETVRVVTTDDPAEPFRLEGPPDLQNRLAVAAAFNGGKSAVKGSANSIELSQANSKIATLQKQNRALVEFIKNAVVVEPIRAAAIRHNAIDDENGTYADVVREVAPLFKVDVEFDPDEPDRGPTVNVYPVASDGNPLIDSNTGNPATVDSMVLKLFARKPKFQKAGFRNGPGAGGGSVSGGRNGSVVTGGGGRRNDPTADEKQAAAAMSIFGSRNGEALIRR